MNIYTRTWALMMALFLLLIPTAALSAGAKTVWVSAYTKGNGTYVSGHWRSPPSGTGAGSYTGSYYTPGYSSTASVTASAAIDNQYKYHVNVFRKGTQIAWGDSTWSDSQAGAEESALWEAQESLRAGLYKAGLSHQEVQVELDKIFSQESCKLDSTSAPHPNIATVIYNESTLTCIAPTVLMSGSRTFPFTCTAMQDAAGDRTSCRTESGVVVLYHEGESLFSRAESSGYSLTISSLPDGSLIASGSSGSNSGSALVKLQPAR